MEVKIDFNIDFNSPKRILPENLFMKLYIHKDDNYRLAVWFSYLKALDLYEQALEIFEQIRRMNLIATTLNHYEGMFDILFGVRERGIGWIEYTSRIPASFIKLNGKLTLLVHTIQGARGNNFEPGFWSEHLNEIYDYLFSLNIPVYFQDPSTNHWLVKETKYRKESNPGYKSLPERFIKRFYYKKVLSLDDVIILDVAQMRYFPYFGKFDPIEISNVKYNLDYVEVEPKLNLRQEIKFIKIL